MNNLIEKNIYMSDKTIIERTITENEIKHLENFLKKEKIKSIFWRFFISLCGLFFAFFLIITTIYIPHEPGIIPVSYSFLNSIICYFIAFVFLILSALAFKNFIYDEKFFHKIALLELDKIRQQDLKNLHAIEEDLNDSVM